MSKSKAAQIAAALNDYRATADRKASNIGVDLYWIGTASSGNGRPQAEVWQLDHKGLWMRKLGTVTLGHDGVWRA